jgi:hypothetical protein
MNADIAAARRSGRSSGENVRAPSISSNFAPGMIFASRSPCSGGKKRSRSDQAMSAGLSHCVSFAAASSV